MYLPDINFWLALIHSRHGHHAAAKSWFDQVPDGSLACFCRLTQLGFLRLSTNPKANPLQTVTMERAWAVYDQALLDPRIGFLDEPAELDAGWRGWSRRQSYSHRVWNDSYRAAFAQAAGLELITFDTGFRQFPGLSCRILK